MNKGGAEPVDGNGGLTWPADDFSRVPYGVYVDQDVHEREQERIFRGPTWSYLGLEAEIPEAGSFITTSIGKYPIILTRNRQGEVRAFVNRCIHRGATVCRHRRGRSKNFLCVYHQWSYDLDGKLLGVPYARGIAGKGGMPANFDRSEHALESVRVALYRGLIFGSFSDAAPDLQSYFDKPIADLLDRTLKGPLRLIGYSKQLIAANWKLYAENTKDPYHAALLHLFHATFGLYRSTQEGGVKLSQDGLHSAIFAKIGTDSDEALEEAFSDTRFTKIQANSAEFKLQDPSLFKGRPEYYDGISTLIMYLFPSVVLQQIGNTLALRKVIPKGTDAFELYWTYFGFADDDAEMQAYRCKQANLIGPAGLISMEDGEATRLVQENVDNMRGAYSLIEMGGVGAIEPPEHLVTETSIRAMWKGYCALMDYRVG